MEQTMEKPMVTVCDIHFRNNAKDYFFDPGSLEVKLGDEVIIDTARGAEFGICSRGNHAVRESEVVAPLRPVLRLATQQDRAVDAENRVREKKAHEICLKKIEDFGLDMQLVSTEYAFDGSKILFFFTADARVDFRELVKSLASVLHSRIELRQIGVRDKAKLVGGLGICGRPFCCREFLEDFQPVSIKMAKTQNLSLNPTKISGTCGRLMCCLNYEQEAYEDLLRTCPKAESFVDTPDGRGTVTEVNLLRQSVKVRLEKQPDTVVCHKNCEICVLRNGKAKKTDEPIPEDLAPISGKRPKKQPPAPAFATYLEPVVLKRSAETVAEAVQGEPEQEKSRRRSQRNRRKNKKPEDKPPKAEPKQEKKPAKAEKLPKEEAPKQEKKPAKAEKPPKEEAPKPEKKPRAANDSGEGQAPAKKNHRRRYYHRHKGGKSEG